MENVDFSKITWKKYSDLSNEEKSELFEYSTLSYFKERKQTNILGSILFNSPFLLIESPSIKEIDLVIEDYQKFFDNHFLQKLPKEQKFYLKPIFLQSLD